MDKIKSIWEKVKEKILDKLSEEDIEILQDVADKIKDKYHNFIIWFWGEDLPKDASVLFPDDEYQRWEQYQYYNELRKKLDRKRFFASIVLFIIGFNLLKFSFYLTKDIIFEIKNIPFIACFGKDICAYAGAKYFYRNSSYPKVTVLKNGNLIVKHGIAVKWPEGDKYYTLCKHLKCTTLIKRIDDAMDTRIDFPLYELYIAKRKKFVKINDIEIDENDVNNNYSTKSLFNFMDNLYNNEDFFLENKDDFNEIKNLAFKYYHTNIDFSYIELLNFFEIDNNKFLITCDESMVISHLDNIGDLCRQTIFYDAENHIVKEGPEFPFYNFYTTPIRIGENKIMFVGGEKENFLQSELMPKQNRVQIFEYRKGK